MDRLRPRRRMPAHGRRRATNYDPGRNRRLEAGLRRYPRIQNDDYRQHGGVEKRRPARAVLHAVGSRCRERFLFRDRERRERDLERRQSDLLGGSGHHSSYFSRLFALCLGQQFGFGGEGACAECADGNRQPGARPVDLEQPGFFRGASLGRSGRSCFYPCALAARVRYHHQQQYRGEHDADLFYGRCGKFG